MNRNEFLRTAALGTIAAGLASGQTLAQESPATPTEPAFRLTSAPVLANVGDDGVTVIVGVSGPSAVAVSYGETAEKLDQIAYGEHGGLNSFDDRVHKVRLTGLKPGTRYFYRVEAQAVKFHNAYKIERGEKVASEIGEFQTLDSQGERCRFVIWNDTHDRAETLAAVHTATEAFQPDFLVWNGDISNDISREEQFTTLFLSPGKQLAHAAKHPLMLVRGNHDLRGAAARHLSRYSDTPGGEPFYSFRQGPVAVIVLDTGEDKPDTHPVYAGLNDFRPFRARQAKWLEQELTKPHVKSAKVRIVCCHIPLAWLRPNEIGSWCVDGAEQWQDILARGGVSLVVSGHTHEWAHLPPDDKRPYHQLIGGGPQLKSATITCAEFSGGKLVVTLKSLSDGKELAKVEVPS